MVPARINDATIRHGSRYRSKGRFPALAYYYKHNGAHITRSAQPMVGFKGNRSIQDEKIVEAMNATSPDPQATANYIIDARPTANALANTARGAGTENVENYKGCSKQFISVDNIHVMRDSLARLVEVIQYSDTAGQRLDLAAVQRTGWLGHIRALLKGTQKIVRMVHEEGANVLVHCSDGWDRTSQLISLSEICLDPYFRTIEGFAVLIEKSWVSFGHKFADRCGHFLPEKPREVSPVFHQFLDCVFQLWVQNPTAFEFSEDLLIDMHFNVYACKFGTFLVNSERERWELQLPTRTASYWDEVLAHKTKFLNPVYDDSESAKELPNPLLIDTKHIRLWSRLFRRDEDSMENEEVDSVPSLTDSAPPIGTPTSFRSIPAAPPVNADLLEPDGWQLPTTPLPVEAGSSASMPATVSAGFMSDDPFGFSRFMSGRWGDAVKVALPAAQAAAGNVSSFFNRWAGPSVPESGSYPPSTSPSITLPTESQTPRKEPLHSKASSWVADLLDVSEDEDSPKPVGPSTTSALSKQIKKESSGKSSTRTSSTNSSLHRLDPGSPAASPGKAPAKTGTTTTITASASGEFSPASILRADTRPLYERSADFASGLKHTPMRQEPQGSLPEELTTNPWDKR